METKESLKNNAIRMLQKKNEELQNIVRTRYGYSKTTFEGWMSSTSILLTRIFGKDSPEVQEIQNLKSQSLYDLVEGKYYHGDTIINAKNILESCVESIEIMGLPDAEQDEKTHSMNLNINQNQNQSSEQSININLVIRALEDNLTINQIAELKAIFQSAKNDGDKTKSLKDKLTEFGSNTLSAIVASLITHWLNPK